MVLRAELVHENRCIIAHTTQLSKSSVFVRTDERLELGTLVDLRLSFPRLFAPLQIAARVVSREGGSGHGYWPGFLLDFVSENEQVARLLSGDHGETPSATFRVLVVEDSATMRDVVQHNAARFAPGFRIDVTTAETAEQARALLEDATFGLAVIDLFLPGTLSGADLVRHMRSRGMDMPVIGFSIGGAEARRVFFDAGVDLFLDKPVMLRDMFSTLERLVRAAGPS
jgi:CheY-like chemotaxis protein